MVVPTVVSAIFWVMHDNIGWDWSKQQEKIDPFVINRAMNDMRAC